ncbi:1,4-alpha-glucan branching protein GlgB [Desulfurivibrio dismutans]|uniref:1,4-alpha-glucan branching protein GlgB n=1 Tax=Desulfurivibrio dismutans TaxID=1398908 RepID=UPI0023DC255A|nr:1,4-alpha-glucan branching protein GlgB [Desulfurivibrio alkaliphilus]MDF1614794.1 1,4-alpha-glucan branching protein GlgB [Desulfurivibrio alkaliphilus]
MTHPLHADFTRIINSDHHDPFQVLGFHLLYDETPAAVVRCFQPAANQVFLLIQGERREMYKVREEGIFEFTLPGCREFFPYQLEAHYSDGASHQFEDPYRFWPQLSDFDRYLINNGTHYQLYDKLGAHPVTIDGVPGTIFRVWAPNARRISVLGNFNFWDGRLHQMRVLAGSGIWELFLPHVGVGEPYKFEIRTAGGDILEKTDPCQFLSEVRPKSASVVWDTGNFSWSDDEWLARRRKISTYRQPMSIYEMHLGSWRRDPSDPSRFLSYREIADALIPYLLEMGFTHVEFLPVAEHPLDESWGYQVIGFYAVTSRFGTPDDFSYLVNECHRHGIGVILDWVPSHFPTDGHGLSRFDGTCLYEHEDPRKGAHQEWGTLVFNYSRAEVANFLIANALFWFERYHIDGLRVDAVASMLYMDYGRQDGEWLTNEYGGRENIEAIEFLKHLNSIVYDRHPDIMMIAEESTSYFGVSKPANWGGLGFGYKWNMGWMNDTLSYFQHDPLFRKYHHGALTFSLLYAFSENFILPLSHDEVVHGKRSLLNKMPGDNWQRFANLRLLLFFHWTHPGKKLLFMGGEFGQLSEWYCKVSLDWHLVEEGEKHRQLQQFVRELNHFYRQTPALWDDDFSPAGFQWLDFNDVDNSIISFARFTEDRKEFVVCLLNFTPQVHYNYKLGVPRGGRYREVLNSDLAGAGGSGVNNPEPLNSINQPCGQAPEHLLVKVPPLGGVIFKLKEEP